MYSISLKEENSFWQKGFNFVAGMDEVGRGPLAGPVVSAAVIFPKQISLIPKIDDSKKITKQLREELFPIILKQAIEVSVSVIDETIIDTININQATITSMKFCIELLTQKPEIVLVDGYGFLYPPFCIKGIVKGDTKVMSIAAASIIAKVIRDRIMDHYHLHYPQYGFNKNYGYPTKLHMKAIQTYGCLSIHRRSYNPIKRLML